MEQPASNFMPYWRVDYSRAMSQRCLKAYRTQSIVTSCGTVLEGVTCAWVRYLEYLACNDHASKLPILDNTPCTV